MASLVVNTHLLTHYFKDHSSHILLHSQSEVWWLWNTVFTKLLCEINIILYSTFEVITPSMEIICEEGWVTQLLLEAEHIQAKTQPFFLVIFQKTFLHILFFLMEEHLKTQKEVIWLFDLVTHSSFIPVFFFFFFNQCLRAKIFNRSKYWSPFLGGERMCVCVFLNMWTFLREHMSMHYLVCAGSRAAGTDYFATPCIIRLRRTKMLVLQTVFVWIRVIPASRTQENSGSFTRHRGKGPSWGSS